MSLFFICLVALLGASQDSHIDALKGTLYFIDNETLPFVRGSSLIEKRIEHKQAAAKKILLAVDKVIENQEEKKQFKRRRTVKELQGYVFQLSLSKWRESTADNFLRFAKVEADTVLYLDKKTKYTQDENGFASVEKRY